MNSSTPARKSAAIMENQIEDMLRQRKLMLWCKILETFPIKQSHRDTITRKLLPNTEPPLVRNSRVTAVAQPQQL